MNSRHFIYAVTTCILLTTTIATVAEETTTVNRFSQLLQVGQAVLLRPSRDHPMYSIQLLSRQQSVEIQTAYDKYVELRKQRDGISTQLETEKQLSEWADFFLKMQSPETEISIHSNTYRLAVYAYEVAHVGEDFVTLEKPQKQKIVPLRSIREINRNESLGSSRFAWISSRSSRNSAARRITKIRLKHTRAAEVAEVVNRIYPDPTREMVVDTDSNLLFITASADSTRKIERLVDILDADVSDTKSSTDEANRNRR